jgi:hypothetical protein
MGASLFEMSQRVLQVIERSGYPPELFRIWLEFGQVDGFVERRGDLSSSIIPQRFGLAGPVAWFVSSWHRPPPQKDLLEKLGGDIGVNLG